MAEDRRDGETKATLEELSGAFTTFFETLEQQLRRKTGERLFPHGVESLDFEASVGDVRVSFKLKGSADLSQQTLDMLQPPPVRGDDLTIGEKVPDLPERVVVGPPTSIIRRDTPEFAALVQNLNPDIVFKDEEGTGADRMMTRKLADALDALATLVKSEWAGTRLRITDAWDENMEHGASSLHYEARAADLTTWPIDTTKYGRLARLAVEAGLDWVLYEDRLHVHASMAK